MKPIMIQRGQSLAEAREQLPDELKLELADCLLIWHESKREEREALDRRNAAVTAALNAGVPARILADQLGITSGRVYQIRKGI
jgi:hypothetical protein